MSASLANGGGPGPAAFRPRVLFFVEGFTDIRFLLGLHEVVDLTVAVPASPYRASGLHARVRESGAALRVEEIPGGRWAFQGRSLAYLWKRAPEHHVILAQEVLRGALNAGLVGRCRGVPVVTCTAIAPREYFACRRERGQISAWKWWVGDTAIRFLLATNGRLATRCLAMGPYLLEVAARSCARVGLFHYYGVDTAYYQPVSPQEKRALRARLGLPADRYIIFLSSRISHEKDPETVLRAASLARQQGLPVLLLNLGGGYQDFLRLAESLQLPGVRDWLVARPAAHPTKELAAYYQSADLVAQASLSEGAGLSPLEGLACGVPAVATAVGGLGRILRGHARLVDRRDAAAMARAFLDLSAHPEAAREEALRGRAFVEREWESRRGFNLLRDQLVEAIPASRRNLVLTSPST